VNGCLIQVYDSLFGADALCGSGDCVIAEFDECISCSFTGSSSAPLVFWLFSECL
jgi:hypothetical protein